VAGPACQLIATGGAPGTCPAAAAELTIRDDVDANLPLHLEHAQDLAILNFTQRLQA
jgi:hypothetical protein